MFDNKNTGIFSMYCRVRISRAGAGVGRPGGGALIDAELPMIARLFIARHFVPATLIRDKRRISRLRITRHDGVCVRALLAARVHRVPPPQYVMECATDSYRVTRLRTMPGRRGTPTDRNTCVRRGRGHDVSPPDIGHGTRPCRRPPCTARPSPIVDRASPRAVFRRGRRRR